MNVADVNQMVRSRYGAFAKTGGRRESCCAGVGEATSSFAVENGLYSEAALALVPDTARKLSVGCGNPVGFANLQSGQTVVDVGCGGGIDAILAAHQVGPQGKVVGIDFAPEMVQRATEAVANAGLQHRVDVHLADIASTELPDDSVDVVISNCVMNLVSDKDAVYREARRILRPGGQVAISDIVLSEPIPADLCQRLQSSWAGCLGGMIPGGGYLDLVRRAGFPEVQMVACQHLDPAALEAMSRCPGPEFCPQTPHDDLAMMRGKVASIKFRGH
jgi:SAM-dependent methyltransferase